MSVEPQALLSPTGGAERGGPLPLVMTALEQILTQSWELNPLVTESPELP